MSRYAQGRAFEYQVIHYLKSLGYWTLRAAGSKGVVDILAAAAPIVPESDEDFEGTAMVLGPDGVPRMSRVLAIQAKRDGVIGPDERSRLIAVSYWLGARPVLAENLLGKLSLREVDERGQRRGFEL